MEVARDLLVQGGLQAVTMRAVAREVGVSATALYRHFVDRDDLLRAVVDAGRDRLTLYLTRGLEAGSPRERLLATGDGYLDFALEHPHDYRVMFLAWEELQIGLHAPDPQGRPSPALQLLMDRVRECRSASPPEEIQALGLMLWAQVHGLASLWVAGGGPAIMPRPHFEAMARAQVRRLVDALFPGSE
ncbi:MAG: helix-turn-helix transcriptional regulator [Myxococcales bacterium]|nr:helix-turn-helix transcriptional regulator [Myxococcales bacterium]